MTASGLEPDDAAGFPGVAPMGAKAIAGTGTVQRTRWGPVIALGLAMLVVTSEMTITAVTLPGGAGCRSCHDGVGVAGVRAAHGGHRHSRGQVGRRRRRADRSLATRRRSTRRHLLGWEDTSCPETVSRSR
ncbi:MAG: hypothetical protein ACRDTE_29145 [Pseudonocardiaceae bacterium]